MWSDKLGAVKKGKKRFRKWKNLDQSHLPLERHRISFNGIDFKEEE
jgi:hypothetical protein